MNRCAIYARISTSNGNQSTDMQILTLRDYCKARDLNIYKEYKDEGISGSKDSRPALDQMMNDARKRKIDTVLVYKFDRFCRSTKHLITALEEFNSLGIDFISYSENIDTSTPMGKTMFTITGAIAELERSLIVDRVKSGLNTARKKGIQLGRPKASFNKETALKLKSECLGLREIASQLGVSKSTLARYLAFSV